MRDLTEAEKALDIESLRILGERYKNRSNNPLTHCFNQILAYYEQDDSE
jgi:hypothetical protein